MNVKYKTEIGKDIVVIMTRDCHDESLLTWTFCTLKPEIKVFYQHITSVII
jgi:hypothetical protein